MNRRASFEIARQCRRKGFRAVGHAWLRAALAANFSPA